MGTLPNTASLVRPYTHSISPTPTDGLPACLPSSAGLLPACEAAGLTVDFITKGPALTASRLAGKKLCIIFADGYTQVCPQTRRARLI